MFWAILCPEVVLYWAMRQWYEAGKVAKEFRRHGWTRRHGLFLLMGGFVLCDTDGQPRRVLAFSHFKRLVQQRAIEFPQLTSLEIQERSNFHPAMGILASLQTIWFIAKFICSSINASPTTPSDLVVVAPFEAMTATVVILNWCTLIFAWKKPLDARAPIFIKSIKRSACHVRNQPPISLNEAFKKEQNVFVLKGTEQRFHLEFPVTFPKFVSGLNMSPRRFISALFWPIKSIYADLFNLIPCQVSGPSEWPDGTLRVPLFFVENTVLQRVVLLPLVILSMAVSTVSFLFLLHPDSSLRHFPKGFQSVWLIASMTSTSVSAVMLGFIFLGIVFYFYILPFTCLCEGYATAISNFCLIILLSILLAGLLPFILARIALLFTSIIGLRSAVGAMFVRQSLADYVPHFS